MQVCCTSGPLGHAGGQGSEAHLETWERQSKGASCTPGRMQPGQPKEGSGRKMAWAGECTESPCKRPHGNLVRETGSGIKERTGKHARDGQCLASQQW